MSGMRILVANPGRVDVLVGAAFSASRRRVAELFRDGAVRLDGRPAKKGTIARPGQVIDISAAPAAASDLRVAPEPGAALKLLHCADEWVLVAKPAGQPSHPLRAGELGTTANALVARFPELAEIGDDPREAGLAHRLDTGTSGILLACRNRDAWERARRAFSSGLADKTYLAVVAGKLGPGKSNAPLTQRGGRSVPDAAGLAAETTWEPLASSAEATLLRCATRSGRMHQVRAHLAARGHPLLGDLLYGGAPRSALVGHFLHAESLSLPSLGIPRATAPLPAERRALLWSLGLEA